MLYESARESIVAQFSCILTIAKEIRFIFTSFFVTLSLRVATRDFLKE